MSALPMFRRRCLSLWLPALPTDRVQRRWSAGQPERSIPLAIPLAVPLALVAKTQGVQRLMAVDRRAHMAGLEAGMALAQARAMVPDIKVLDHQPHEDARLLEAIADWADRYTPLVGRHPPDGLLLDITGAAHLQGGEAALRADLLGRLARQGFAATAAIAPSPGAAWALARCQSFGQRTGQSEPVIVPPEASQSDLDAILAPLPISGLRLAAQTVAALHRVGLKRIGDLIGRPRAALAARFGMALIVRLDQARAIDDEAISPRQPVPPAVVEQGWAEPILTTEAVTEACRGLSDQLAAVLIARGQGATSLQLAVYRVDGLVKRIDLGLASPCREASIMARLLALRLGALDDPLDPGFGYDLVRLAATSVAACSPESRSLPGLVVAAAAAELADHRARLLDRLSARFGNAVISVHIHAASHIPEQAARLVSVQQVLHTATGAKTAEPRGEPSSQPSSPRPLRLFDPPELVEVMAEVPDGAPLNIRWRRRPLRIVAADGPERIAPEWWTPAALAAAPRDRARTRDYWRVEDTTGRRLWLYREGLYGAADASTETLPRWYVHGLFA
jgi:protein ImuB